MEKDRFGTDWSARLRSWMSEKGWNPKELEKRSKVDYENLIKYINGKVANPRGNVLGMIAKAFDMSVKELRYGLDINDKTSSSGQSTRTIPRVNMVDLARHQPDQKITNIWSGEMSIVVDKSISAACVAVDIDDDSMSPDFNPGDVAICNPEAEITPGSLVIAKASGIDKGVLRKYRITSISEDGSKRIELKPINDDYPVLTIDGKESGHIIGRVEWVMKRV